MITINFHSYILVFSLIIFIMFEASLTLETFLTTEDKSRFQSILTLKPPFSNYQLANIFYSIQGLSYLTSNINSVINSKDNADLCNYLKTFLEKPTSIENIFYAYSSAHHLNCQLKQNSALIQLLENRLKIEPQQKDDALLLDHYRSAVVLNYLGIPLDPQKINQLIKSDLKRDESLHNLGLAFRLQSLLKKGENIFTLSEKFSSVIAQADEVDGRYLQFEGNLGVTSNLIVGIYSLASVSNKSISLSNEQALKFVNYFLSRKTVQTPKGISELLEVLKLFSKNKYHIPVCISIYGSSTLNERNMILSLKVSNIFGQSLQNDLVVKIENSILGQKPLKGVQGDSTIFSYDLGPNNLKRGEYTISVTVSPPKPDNRFIGNTNVPLKFIVATKVTIEKPEIKIADRDQPSSFKGIVLSYPSFYETQLEADFQHKLTMKFRIKDVVTNEIITAHQVFVQLQNAYTNQEIIYVAELDTPPSDFYKFDLNVAARAKDFGHESGLYHISLIVGDSKISNPFFWKIASIKLSFPEQISSTLFKQPQLNTQKPIINHIFRKQEKRPSNILSDTFTVLALSPLLVLLILWIKLGVNFSKFRFSLSALIFHFGIGSIFILFTLFWLRMNMFTTIKYLLGIGVITFLSGHRALRLLAVNSYK